jgi:hypothetical protein
MSLDKPPREAQEEVAPFSPCIYFVTQSHLYVAVFRWQDVRDETGEVRERSQWRVEFIAPLLEMPMIGDHIFHMIDNVTSEGRDAIWIPQIYDAVHLGAPSRARPLGGDLDVHKIVLIRPSHTPRDIAVLMETYGALWFEQASNLHWFHQPPPPPPSVEVQVNEQGEQLYDLSVVESAFNPLSLGGLFVRLTYTQVVQKARSLVEGSRPDDMILRYFEEEATLQWMNAVYTDVGPIPEFDYQPHEQGLSLN